MDDTAGWRCPRCQTTNGLGDRHCLVCTGSAPAPSPAATPVPTQPAVPVVASGPATAAPRPEPTGPNGGGPAPVALPTPASTTGAGPSRSWRPLLIGAAALLVLAGAVGAGVALGSRNSNDPVAETPGPEQAAPGRDAPAPDVETVPTSTTAPPNVATTPSIGPRTSTTIGSNPTTGPTTTSGGRTLPAVPDESAYSVQLIQDWASSLATGDWASARRRQPEMAQTDSQLEASYGGLIDATIVFVSESGSVARVASVAHEDVNGQRTNVYCFVIETDQTAETIRVQGSSRATPTSRPGWIDPSALVDEILSCG